MLDEKGLLTEAPDDKESEAHEANGATGGANLDAGLSSAPNAATPGQVRGAGG